MSYEDEWDEEVHGDRDWENYDRDHSEDIKRAEIFKEKVLKILQQYLSENFQLEITEKSMSIYFKTLKYSTLKLHFEFSVNMITEYDSNITISLSVISRITTPPEMARIIDNVPSFSLSEVTIPGLDETTCCKAVNDRLNIMLNILNQ